MRWGYKATHVIPCFLSITELLISFCIHTSIDTLSSQPQDNNFLISEKKTHCKLHNLDKMASSPFRAALRATQFFSALMILGLTSYRTHLHLHPPHPKPHTPNLNLPLTPFHLEIHITLHLTTSTTTTAISALPIFLLYTSSASQELKHHAPPKHSPAAPQSQS